MSNRSYPTDIILIIVCFLTSLHSHATTHNPNHHLKEVSHAIQLTKHQLRQQHHQYIILQKQLKKIELQLAHTAKQLQAIKQPLKRSQQHLKLLHKQQLAATQHLRTQFNLLSNQLQSYYKLGQQSTIKLLLNQDNVQTSNQLLHYYHYINQARSEALDKLTQSIQKLQTLSNAANQQQEKLTHLKQQQQQVLQQLKIKQSQRHVILVKLQQTISNQEQRLQRLQADKAQLEQTLRKANQHRLITATTFSKNRGHLHWPTRGHIAKRFNTPIANSQLTWNGELIAAPAGQAVHAIASGKVIYSDWLRGFGLLIIIDHGQGYMSLYARNQALYKKSGESVTTEELIALVGHSGGFNTDGLYFEIRHNGHPLNPSQWCQNSVHYHLI